MNTKILPLVAIMSGLLVGCSNDDSGSSGGSDGGGTTPSTNDYTLTLLQKFEYEASDTRYENCRIYSRETVSEIDSETLALVDVEYLTTYRPVGNAFDALVFATITDSDGEQVGEKVNANNGVLTVDLDSVPSGGAVTIQERFGRDIFATSYTKEFLANDATLKNLNIGVYTAPVSGTCVTGGNRLEVVKDDNDFNYSNSTHSDGNSDGNSHFVSKLEMITSLDNSLPLDPDTDETVEFSAISDEETMLVQYRSDNVNQVYRYGFEDWDRVGGRVHLRSSDMMSPIYGIAATEVDSNEAEIYLSHQGYTYPYATLDLTSDTDFYRPTEANNESWHFSLDGEVKSATTWNAEFKGGINTDTWNLDVDPSDVVDLSNATDNTIFVTVVDDTRSIEFTGTNALTSEKRSRVVYRNSELDSGVYYTVTHTVYSEDQNTIVVPNLDYTNFPTSIIDDLKVSNSSAFTESHLYTEDEGFTNRLFLSLYSHGDSLSTEKDGHGVVYSELDYAPLVNTIDESVSVLISR
jgi:hypothetical protein